jgi:hypothetical protein
MKTKTNVKRLRTTLGELVIAITDAALEVSRSERAAYRLTGLVLNRMLQPVPVIASHRPTNPHRRHHVR